MEEGDKKFSEILARTRLGESMREAAYYVFIRGFSISESARRAGVSKSGLREAVARLKRAYRESLGCPRDWEVVTVCLPRDKARRIKKWADRLREKAKAN